MKQIILTFTDKEYAKLQECKCGRFADKSDVHVLKHAITSYIKKKRKSMYRGSVKAVRTKLKNRKLKDREAAKAYMEKKRELKKQNSI